MILKSNKVDVRIYRAFVKYWIKEFVCGVKLDTELGIKRGTDIVSVL